MQAKAKIKDKTNLLQSAQTSGLFNSYTRFYPLLSINTFANSHFFVLQVLFRE